MIDKKTLKSGKPDSSGKLDLLRLRINDENYLRDAIQSMALVMSNELLEITREGGYYERQRT